MYRNAEFSSHVWEWGMNKASAEVVLSGNTRDGNFRISNVSWIHVNHHSMGVVMSSSAWLLLGDNFCNTSMESILICGVLRIVKYIWDYPVKGIEIGVNPHYQSLVKGI